MEKSIPLKDGNPRYIRCYDNGGETFDRYTVVYTKKRISKRDGFLYIGMSKNPFHPQGFGQHGETDVPRFNVNVGRPIKFNDLPEDCQKAVWQDYKDIWS